MGPLVKRLTICTVAELVRVTLSVDGETVLIRKNGSLPLLRQKQTVAGLLPTETRSGLPSPSKSPAATAIVLIPAERSTRAANELLVRIPGVLTFQNAEILELLVLPQTISTLPSPSNSATASPRGPKADVRLPGKAKDAGERMPGLLIFR